MAFLDEYKAHCSEREALGIPPLALNADQVTELVALLKNGGKDAYLAELLATRVSPGVDDAAGVKAKFLDEVVSGAVKCESIDAAAALEMLGKMLGGYNVAPLVKALASTDATISAKAAEELKHTLLVYDYFNDVVELSKTNAKAKEVVESWANGEWFTKKPAVADEFKMTVFKVPGETNTDDLSPAGEAHTRADIPMHAKAMLRAKMPDGLNTIVELKKKGLPIAYVGDVVGTGSSRKSATNSVQWHCGFDIPGVPNKRTGGVVIGGVIAPIFFATCEDSGALPIQASDVTQMESGDEITINIVKGTISKNGAQIATFKVSPNTILDEVRAGGRVPLIIGRGLTAKARAALGLGASTLFKAPEQPKDTGKGYTLAQKMVGKACGVTGVRPGTYCEPMTLTVGSQDTTGAMTREEVKELAALGFSADLVMQSFCHTAAYPKPADVKLHATLPTFIASRGGVALRPGDGVIHSWLNRMVLPDTVGTGGDSHTRFPIGVSFPAGSGLVAFAAVTGAMPLEMPESVLVRFKGELQPGITLRDLVNAIPYYAIKQGLLTVEKKGKKNIFNGKVLEIEGLPNLKVEQAFELSDASAERSAAACTVKLNKEPVIEYLKSNIVLLEAMIAAGYQDPKTLQRRADKMKEWIANPVLLEADADAEYACVIEIDLADVKEPIVACPNDPDAVELLSNVAGEKIDEVFLGSCMTNIGHYRAAGEVMRNEGKIAVERWWIVPPTKMDEKQLQNEGYYEVFNKVGARTEMPGCSLCMGNQAQTREGAVVFSTSTRNFDNRMGINTRVYLGSAELASVCAKLGKIPTVAEYMSVVPAAVAGKEAAIYKYLNFNQIENYKLADRS